MEPYAERLSVWLMSCWKKSEEFQKRGRNFGTRIESLRTGTIGLSQLSARLEMMGTGSRICGAGSSASGPNGRGKRSVVGRVPRLQ